MKTSAPSLRKNESHIQKWGRWCSSILCAVLQIDSFGCQYNYSRWCSSRGTKDTNRLGWGLVVVEAKLQYYGQPNLR